MQAPNDKSVIPKICIPCLRSYLNETYSCPICGSDLTPLWDWLQDIEAVSGLPLNEFGEMEGG